MIPTKTITIENMTTLEITLLSTVIYLLIGIAVEFFGPEERLLIPDPAYEKFLIIMTIFFWPLVIVCITIDYWRDIFE